MKTSHLRPIDTLHLWLLSLQFTKIVASRFKIAHEMVKLQEVKLKIFISSSDHIECSL